MSDPLDVTEVEPAGALVPVASAVPQVARVATLSDKVAYAQELAKANMLPKAFRHNPANVLVAIEYGEMLNLHTMVAINHIHVVEGKPSMSAELMRARVRECGHRLRILSNTDKLATVEITRKDDPGFPLAVNFTIEDAQRAKLVSKDNWKNYPASMLLARATSACVRAQCPEATMGVGYVPEELGAEVDADGRPVWVESTSTPAEEMITQEQKDELDKLLADFTPAMRDELKAWRQSKDISIRSGEFTKGNWEQIMGKARDLWIAHAAEKVEVPPEKPTPGPIASTPARVMQEAIDRIEAEEKALVDLPPSASQPLSPEIGTVSNEQIAEIAGLQLNGDQAQALKAWAKAQEPAIATIPSKSSAASYARLIEQAHEIKESTIDLEFRGYLGARLSDLGKEYEGAYEAELNELGDQNPCAGIPWRQQLDRLPADWDDYLRDQIEALEELHAKANPIDADAPVVYADPAEEPF
jgi:hypothetical protein